MDLSIPQIKKGMRFDDASLLFGRGKPCVYPFFRGFRAETSSAPTILQSYNANHFDVKNNAF